MSNATKQAPALSDTAVDEALRSWRTETDRRRAAYQTTAEAYNAEQSKRRRELARGLAVGGASLAVLITGMAWFFSEPVAPVALAIAPPTPAVVRPVTPPAVVVAPVVVNKPAVVTEAPVVADKPVVAVAPVVADKPVVAVVPVVDKPIVDKPSSTSIALSGDVRHWAVDGTLWVQLDYTGEALELRWLDGQGAAVLEPTPCDNRVDGVTRRCYVGRTAERIAVARAAGAVPGTWTAQACRDTQCLPVATFDVD